MATVTQPGILTDRRFGLAALHDRLTMRRLLPVADHERAQGARSALGGLHLRGRLWMWQRWRAFRPTPLLLAIALCIRYNDSS